MSARERLSASTWCPSSSRSSRISSSTMPRSMSMSRKAGCESTSPKSAHASSSDSGGQREREDAVVDLRRGEERAAEALEREVHRVRARHAARTPVDHVLEEVADAVVRARLESRADAATRGRRARGEAAAAGRRRPAGRSPVSSVVALSTHPRLRWRPSAPPSTLASCTNDGSILMSSLACSRRRFT